MGRHYGIIYLLLTERGESVVEDFLTRVKNKGAYIALMEDWIEGAIEGDIDPNINPAEFIMKNNNENKYLKKSCDDLNDALHTKEMEVGNAPKGYVEPCPIAYTGNLQEGNKFKVVFLGLNPHLEPPRYFDQENKDKETKFADLGNYHHPHDIYNGFDSNRYNPKGVISNEYWRVLGHMESGEPWSPFYQIVILIYKALLGDKVFNTWKDFANDKKLEIIKTEGVKIEKSEIEKLAKSQIEELINIEIENLDEDNKKMIDNDKKENVKVEIRKLVKDELEKSNEFEVERFVKAEKMGTKKIETLVKEKIGKLINPKKRSVNDDGEIVKTVIRKIVNKILDDYLSIQLISELRKNPIANAELIPYKTTKFTITKWAELIQDKTKEISKTYRIYLNHIFKFIESYSEEDAYIVITMRVDDMSFMYKYLTTCESIDGDIFGGLYWFGNDGVWEKDFIHEDLLKQIKIDEKKYRQNYWTILKSYINCFRFCDEKQNKFNIPIYLLHWKNHEKKARRIIIIPSISSQSSYGRVLAKLESNNWIYKVKNTTI